MKTTALWKADSRSLSQWHSRERETLASLNLLLTTIFRSELEGARLPGLRTSLAFVVSPSLYSRVKRELGVTIPRA